MRDFLNQTLFVYKMHHGNPQGGFWLFLTHQASSKTLKIHHLGDHAASYIQRLRILYILPKYIIFWFAESFHLDESKMICILKQISRNIKDTTIASHFLIIHMFSSY